jgi:CO/xanthine dehydrogenase Mo-binding subunit
MACMWYPIGFTVKANPSMATLKMNEDGSAVLLTGTVETGQGSLTVLSQIAAEELGIPASDVAVVSADTDATPVDTGAIASRTTYVTGNAIRRAAVELKNMLFTEASQMLGVQSDQLETFEGTVRVKGFPQKSIPIGKVVFHSQVVLGRPLMASAAYNPPTVPMDSETGQGKPFNTYVYAAQIVEVEVDTETGEVDVLRVVAAHDCGTAINPMLVEGQVQGGVAMGIGFALSEEVLYAEGRQVNPSLTNYMVPTAMDVPHVEVVIVDNYDPTGPFGAKGVGEPTLVPTAAAVANAIYDALGVRITSLPATPEKILRALREQEKAVSPGAES